jgi:hypothetical protein
MGDTDEGKKGEEMRDGKFFIHNGEYMRHGF